MYHIVSWYSRWVRERWKMDALSVVPWGASVEGALVVFGIMPYIKCISLNIVLKYQTMYHVCIKKYQG